MENQVMLKKTMFGGFDKRSVLNYIYELNASAKEAQDKLAAQMEELTASREKLSETLQEMEARLQDAQRERDKATGDLDGERKRTGELSAMIDSLKTEIARQERTAAELEDERRRTAELTATIDALKVEIAKQEKLVADLEQGGRGAGDQSPTIDALRAEIARQERIIADLEQGGRGAGDQSATVDALRAEIARQEKTIAGLKDAGGKQRQDTVAGAISDASGKIDALKAEIARLERLIAERDETIAGYRRMNNELMEKYTVLEANKEEVDKATAYLGELLLRARMEEDHMSPQASRRSPGVDKPEAGSLNNRFDAFRRELEDIQFRIQRTLSDLGSAVQDAEKDLYAGQPTRPAYSVDPSPDRDFFRPSPRR